ncbi:MAG TPA: PA domain-containing protein [Polyangiaceae bacterium]|nr:PA domain-containing protein [Polyangiaceae bacterium]
MARSPFMQLGKTGTAGTAAAATVLALSFASVPCKATSIVVQDTDADGMGFKDPTPVPAVGGNTATTRGAQALAVFNQAASVWSAALDAPVEIRVAARFGALECSADSGVLGQGSPTSYAKNWDGAPLQNTWYPVALANQLAKTDLTPGQQHIDLVVNGAAGTSGCLENSGWYFGLDGNSGNATDLFTVVVHELGHGLGMTTPMDLDTGNFYQGLPDVFSTLVLDDRTGTHWSEMTAAARVTSARDFHQLSWDGAKVTAAAPSLLSMGMPELKLGGTISTLDAAIAVASFGPALSSAPVTGVLSAVADDTPPAGDACGTPAALTDKIAFIEAGGPCSDVDKAVAVQNQGAVAAILVNTTTGFVPIAPSGSDGGKVTIPVVRINQTDATTIRAALSAAPSAQLWANPNRALGTSTTGHVYLDATDPVTDHVSVTHWDPMIQPHLLMQPAYLSKHDLDLTLPLMEDLGWTACTGSCRSLADGGVVVSDGGGGAAGQGGASGQSGASGKTDAGAGGQTGGAVDDAGTADSGTTDMDGSTYTVPTGRITYSDSGLLAPTGIGGIPWAPRPSGCNCRVEAAEHEPGGLAAMLVGLAALLRRRSRSAR